MSNPALLLGGPWGWAAFGVLSLATVYYGAQAVEATADAINDMADDEPLAPPATPCTNCDQACPACTPPAGTFEVERVDAVPPGRPHAPCPGDHMHTRIMNQNPRTCACFWNKGPVICLIQGTDRPLDPGTTMPQPNSG